MATGMDAHMAADLQDIQARASAFRLKATPDGFKAFSIKLGSKIGPELKQVMRTAILEEELDPPINSEMRVKHERIYDAMVNAFVGEYNEDLLLRMSSECGQLGPKCLV